jgi:hypothetical protein
MRANTLVLSRTRVLYKHAHQHSHHTHDCATGISSIRRQWYYRVLLVYFNMTILVVVVIGPVTLALAGC